MVCHSQWIQIKRWNHVKYSCTWYASMPLMNWFSSSVFIYNYFNFQKYEYLLLLVESIEPNWKNKKKTHLRIAQFQETVWRISSWFRTRRYWWKRFMSLYDPRNTSNYVCSSQPKFEWIIEKWGNVKNLWWCGHSKELNISTKSINSAGLS